MLHSLSTGLWPLRLEIKRNEKFSKCLFTSTYHYNSLPDAQDGFHKRKLFCGIFVFSLRKREI